MKFYIYGDGAGTIYAISEDGERLAHHEVNDGVDADDGDVLIVRDLVYSVYPGPHQALWVKDAATHPVVSKLLELEKKRDELKQLPDAVEHECAVCVHSTVCVGAQQAEAVGFKVHSCEQHIAIPTGEET